MKTKYIIGIAVGMLFVALAIYSFNSTKIVYSDFQKAEQNGEVVKISGIWVKDQPSNFNSKTNEFHFTMIDDSSNVCEVVYRGAKPNNFDVAHKVLLTGRYDKGKFHASEIMTKCPSKYEAGYEDMKSQTYKGE